MAKLPQADSATQNKSARRAATAYKIVQGLGYVHAGYPVLLVAGLRNGICTCPAGRACKTPGKHPLKAAAPHGYKSATRNKAKIVALIREYPDCNLGIATRKGLYFFVDIDPRNGGKTKWIEMFGAKQPRTPTQKSGSGDGRHMIFDGKPPPWLKGIDGIDVIENGYIVAEPSTHTSGNDYEWKRKWPENAKRSKLPRPIKLPEALRKHTRNDSPRKGQYSLSEVEAALESIPADEYERWIRYGQALKHDFPVEGESVWTTWSQKSSKWQSGDGQRWETFDQNSSAEPVTCASILSDARRQFRYRPRPTEFDAVADPNRSLVVVDADKEHLVNVDWLWPDHIPRGMLTLAAGEAGEGKSTVMAALAAIVTRGGEWPDGSEMGRPGRCIWLCVEDPVNSVLLPRAVAAGIDRKRLKVVTGVRNQEGDEMVFSLQDDLALLRAELKKQPDTDFVVIDPVTAYLHGKRRVDLNNATDLRAILSPLAKLAEQENVAIVCVTHLNKDEGRSFIHRVLGSQVWTAAARIVWAFGRMPESANNDAVMIEAKRNVGQRTAAVKYRIETAVAKEGKQEIKTSKVEWLGEDGSIGLHEVFGNQRGPRASSKQACGAWLRMRLAKGPVNANVLNVEAARMDSVFGERVYNGERSRLCDYDRKAHAYTLKSEFASADTPSSVATGSDSPDDLF